MKQSDIARQLRNMQRRNEREQEGLKIRLRELEKQHKLNAEMIAVYEANVDETR